MRRCVRPHEKFLFGRHVITIKRETTDTTRLYRLYGTIDKMASISVYGRTENIMITPRIFVR